MPERIWHGSRWIRPSTRLAIYDRDMWKCVYCQMSLEDLPKSITLDHFIPVTKGGTNHHTNLVTSCRLCNYQKSHKTIRQWLKWLRNKGIETTKIAARIRRRLRKPLNRKRGRELLALRLKEKEQSQVNEQIDATKQEGAV